jgi:hypothetical protein
MKVKPMKYRWKYLIFVYALVMGMNLVNLPVFNPQQAVPFVVITLTDYQPQGDNWSPALSAALAEAASHTGRSTKIVIPKGDFKLTTPVAQDFQTSNTDIVIEGEGSGSTLRLASGGSTINLSLTGASSMTLRNFVLSGVPSTVSDARIGLNLDSNVRTLVDNLVLYNYASHEEGGAVMRVARTNFIARGLSFEGSNGYGFIGVPVLLIDEWTSVDVEGFNFADYRNVNGGAVGKNSAAGKAWIHLKNPYNQSPVQGIARFASGFMDEGASIGILSEQDVGRDATVIVDGLGVNVANTSLGIGVKFKGTKIARVLNSKFGLVQAAPRVIASFENVERATVDGVRGTQEAKIVTANAGVKSLTVRDSSFDTLKSDAALTRVTDSNITTLKVTGKLILDPEVAPPPFAAVTGITGTPTNGGGGASRTYWVVAVDAHGRRSPLSAPYVLRNAWQPLWPPSNLAHYLSWSPVHGAVSYDVLRDEPTRKVISVAGTTYTDRYESYSAYTAP